MSAPLNGAQEQQTWRGGAQLDDSVNLTTESAPSGQTGRQIADSYNPDATNWGREAIEASAVAVTTSLPSLSEYAETTDPIGKLADFVRFTDAHAHALYVEFGAIVGDPASTALVTEKANAGDQRAQAVLKFAASVDKLLGLA